MVRTFFVSFQVLFYPVTDGTNFNSSSYITYQKGYYLTRDAMKWFWDNYAPDRAIRNKPTVSPLQASIDGNSKDYRLHLSSQMNSMYFVLMVRHMLTSSLR
jgi:acetyl esterase/lipase